MSAVDESHCARCLRVPGPQDIGYRPGDDLPPAEWEVLTERTGRMSNRRKLRSYGQRARAAVPGYVTPDAECDVPACDRPVGGSRTFTFIRQDEPPASVLVRLCTGHTGMSRCAMRRFVSGRG